MKTNKETLIWFYKCADLINKIMIAISSVFIFIMFIIISVDSSFGAGLLFLVLGIIVLFPLILSSKLLAKCIKEFEQDIFNSHLILAICHIIFFSIVVAVILLFAETWIRIIRKDLGAY